MSVGRCVPNTALGSTVQRSYAALCALSPFAAGLICACPGAPPVWFGSRRRTNPALLTRLLYSGQGLSADKPSTLDPYTQTIHQPPSTATPRQADDQVEEEAHARDAQALRPEERQAGRRGGVGAQHACAQRPRALRVWPLHTTLDAVSRVRTEVSALQGVLGCDGLWWESL